MNEEYNFDICLYDELLERGLSNGLGKRNGQMCIEAAVCAALGLPHGDDPGCVASSVRRFKIILNDSNWSSLKARAKGLRDLGIAQLGSLGIVDNLEFTKRLVEKIIRIVIPRFFREVFTETECLEAALECERNGTFEAVQKAAEVASRLKIGTASNVVSLAADAAFTVSTEGGKEHINYAAELVGYIARYLNSDVYFELFASIALEILAELKSPGATLLKKEKLRCGLLA